MLLQQFQVRVEGKLNSSWLDQCQVVFDSTLLILYRNFNFGAVKVNLIVHYGKDGKPIKKYCFQQQFKYFKPISDCQFVVPLFKVNQLVIVNLRDQSQKRVPFNFEASAEFRIHLHFFINSKFLCIREEAEKHKITYLNTTNFKVVDQCYIERSQHPPEQCNEHSMLLFYGFDFYQQIPIQILVLYELTSKGITRRTIQIPRSISSKFPNDIVVFCFNQKQILIKEFIDYQRTFFTHFINLDNGSVRQLKAPFDPPNWFVTDNQIVINDHNASRLIVISKGTMKTVLSIPLNSFKDGYWSTYDCSWNNNIRPVVKTQKQNYSTIKVIIVNFKRLKDWWMQMLLHLNEDFDDDLLLDAIKLLPESEQ